jgi:pimeloyl-ACP methyl ester carboxylesterase
MHPQPPRRSTHASGRPKDPLVYDRWGEFGRPVVLLHGLLLDRTMWWPAAAELVGSSSCTIVAPDLPGHGQSPPRADYRLEHIARDLAALVDGLHLRRAPLVVGHAASARLATAFADAYATHCLLTLDEPPVDATDVAALSPAGLELVPEIFRPYAEPRTDPALLHAYGSWLAQPPTRRNQPAMAGRSLYRPAGTSATFLPLTDPEAFAAVLRGFL